VPGDFILAKQYDFSIVVCNARYIVWPHSLEVVWWREKIISLLCPYFYQNVVRSRVREIYADEPAPSVFLVILKFTLHLSLQLKFWSISGQM
jgi:hypothetical protein